MSTSLRRDVEDTDHTPAHRRVSASEALQAAVASLDKEEPEIKEIEKKDKSDDDDDVEECFSKYEPREAEQRHKQSIVVLVTSDDRLELTLTPGAVETIFEIVKVESNVLLMKFILLLF